MMRVINATLMPIITTIFFSAAILLAVPVEFSQKALWLTLCVPLIWVGLMFWASWESRSRKVFFAMLGLTIFSIIIVYLNPPTQ